MSMTWQRFQQLALPLLKLYRDDYITLHEVYFDEMNLNEPVVADIINWLYEKPMKKYLDAELSKGFKDEYDQLVDVIEQSKSFEEANIGSHKIFRE